MCGVPGEWCSDYYSRRYDPNDHTDPRGPQLGEFRVLRGRLVTTYEREKQRPDLAGVEAGGGAGIYGFRILMEAD